MGQIAAPSKPQGRDWEPPKVAMEAPAFCRENSFTVDTCFNCVLVECYFNMLPERMNDKKKKTKDDLRKEGLLPPLARRRNRNGNGR